MTNFCRVTELKTQSHWMDERVSHKLFFLFFICNMVRESVGQGHTFLKTVVILKPTDEECEHRVSLIERGWNEVWEGGGK